MSQNNNYKGKRYNKKKNSPAPKMNNSKYSVNEVADKFTKENDWKKYFPIVTCFVGMSFIASSSLFYLAMF